MINAATLLAYMLAVLGLFLHSRPSELARVGLCEQRRPPCWHCVRTGYCGW